MRGILFFFVLQTASKHGKTPTEVIRQLQQNFREGELVDQASPNQVQRKLENLGFKKGSNFKQGYLKAIQIQIIFRKGA